MNDRRTISSVRVLKACRWAVPLAVLFATVWGHSPHAEALTNSATTLDVGSGESITLDGVREYTSHIAVHDGGVVYVGATGALTLKTPTLTVSNSGHVSATGKGASGSGGTLLIDCDVLSMSGASSSIEAAGAQGSSADNWGKSGGSITIRVAQSATLDAGVVSAAGGWGYVNTSGYGGAGGAIHIRGCGIALNGSGTRVDASGGSARVTDDEIGGMGGAGGSITLAGATVARTADISARGGDGGTGDESGGDGGAGGAARSEWAVTSGAGAVNVSGGLGGGGNFVSGTAGAPGTWSNLTRVNVPFDSRFAVVDGYIDDATVFGDEYKDASRWTYDAAGRVIYQYVEEDGSSLRVAFRDSRYYEYGAGAYAIYVDVNGDGGTAPHTDDYLFAETPSGWVEYRGTGSGWASVAQSGWGVAQHLRGYPLWYLDTEFTLPYALLGITAGQAKTMRVALGASNSLPLSGSTGMWPSTSSANSPSTWPELSSWDLWTAFQNVAPGTSPGQWINAQPAAWTSDSTPDCSIQVQDSIAGLDVSTAQYRYSTNGGTSWSSWLSATCSGTDGTQALQTLTASSVPLSDSGSANNVQFRVRDMGGLTGTSGLCSVMVDSTSPSGWTSFVPSTVVTNTLAPDCTVRVQDAGSGLNVASAQYQYSTNGGSSWSAWAAATCTGASGTTAQEQISAHEVPFLRNSTTQNRIRFRIANLAGSTSTSGEHTVQIAAPLTGLPANGNFEVGIPGAVPSLWSVSAQNYVPGYASTTHWAYEAEVTGAERYEGAQALRGGISAQPDGAPRYAGGIAQVTPSGSGDYSGTSQVELLMRDIDVGAVDPTSIVYSMDCYIALTFSDGVAAAAQTYLYRNVGGTIADSRTGTVTGADGQSWGRYVVAIPAQFDKSRLTVGVKWQAFGGFDVGYVALVSDVHASSVIDFIHAIDPVAPVSSASVSGASWSMTHTRNVSYSAADNAALDSVELWSRADTGTGFGSWTLSQTRSVVGTTAAGTFSVSTPADGRYEFYTRARDAAGTYESAPGSADATYGVDTTPPSGNVNFTPSGWVSTLSPACAVDVRDAWAGLGATPVRGDSLPDESVTVKSLRVGSHLYTADKDTVGVFDLADPASPSRIAAVGVAGTVTDIAADGAGEWIFAGLGDTGLVPVSLADPADPRPGTVIGHLGDVGSLDAGVVHGNPIVIAGDRAGGVLAVLDASQPSKGLQIAGTIGMHAEIADVSWDGHRFAYVGLVNGSVKVVDIGDPGSPELVDELDAGSAIDALDVSGDRLAVCAGNSLIYFWVAQGPGSIDLTGDVALGDSASDVAVVGNRAFVSVAGSERVISLPPDASPAQLWSLDTGGGITMTSEVNDAYLYTHNDTTGLRTWLLAEPAYQCSSDAGATWGEWLGATCNVAEGSAATATLGAPETDFSGDSATSNMVRFRFADVLGNFVVGAAKLVRADTTAPTVASLTSSSHPVSSTWYDATTCSGAWTVGADLSGVAGYSVVWDDSAGTVPPASVSTTGVSASKAGAAEGVHYLHVRAVDVAGNWGAASHLMYRVDTQAPTAPIGAAATPTASAVNSFSVSWSAPAQTYAPIGGCYCKLDAVPTSATDGTFVAGSEPSLSALEASGEGVHTVYVWLRDAAGNASHANRASATFVYDASAASAPVISSGTHPVQSAWYSSPNVALSWVSTDSVSAVTGCSWALDTSPGTVPDEVPDSAASTTTTVLPSEGAWYFHVRTVNAVGLWSDTSTFALRYDSKGPSLTSLTSSTHPAAANWYPATTCSAEWTVDSDLSGVVGYSCVWDDVGGTLPPASVTTTGREATHVGASEGTHYLHVRAVDGAGNWGPVAHLTYQVDVQPPDAPNSLSASPTASAVDSFSVSWTAPTQTYAPIGGCYYKLDVPPTSATDGKYVSGTGSAIDRVAGKTEGTHTVYVWLRDAAGNASHSNRASTTFVYDASAASAPVISSGTHPVQSAWYSSPNVALSWVSTDSVSAIGGYSWALDTSPGTVPDTIVDSTMAASTTVLPSEGTWYFHVRSVNALGLWSGTSTFELRYDAGGPTGTMSLDGDALATAQTTVTVDSALSDASPMTMRVSTDGGVTWGTWSPYSASVEATLAGDDGAKTVAVQYTDAAGHSATCTDTIILDRVAPALTLSAAARYVAGATIRASAEDTASGVQTLQMQVDGGPWVSTSALSVTVVGGHWAAARAVDAAGNASTRTVSFTIVAAPKAVSLTKPSVSGKASARKGTRLKGKVWPKHSCRVLVEVQVYKKRKYRKYKTLYAKCYSSRQWSYKAKLKKGTYRVRARTRADANYRAAVSGWRKVRVK